MVERDELASGLQVEEDLSEQAAWQIQLRWFSSIGILWIRFRWLAGLGVLAATWIATWVLNVPLSPWPLYAIGLCILAYNAALQYYLNRHLAYPSRLGASGYDYGAVLRYYWRGLEKEGNQQSAAFDRFIKVQIGLDWLAMILLVHFSGGVHSPLLFFFAFHLIAASVLLSRRARYGLATIAVLAVGVLFALEYAGVIPHVLYDPGVDTLHLSSLYIAGTLVFFSASLYIVVFLTTLLTAGLRQTDEKLLRVQQRLVDASRRNEALYEVTRTINSTLNLDKVLDLISQSAAETMGVRGCAIMLVEEGSQVLQTLASYGLSEHYRAQVLVDAHELPVIREAFVSGQPVLVSSAADERLRYPESARAEGIASILCVPLDIRGRTEGVVCVFSAIGDHFEQDDAEFLAALSSAGGAAIENARTYQALEMVDRAKSDFVRMMTHEFRSPLSAVQSMLALIDQGLVGPLTEKQQDLIERSQRRLSHLLDLVRDLLELAAGKMEMLTTEKTQVDLGAIVAKVAELERDRAEEKGQALDVEIAPEPLVLSGFEEGLERVVMNLVSNAIKYTPSGGSVSVRAWREYDRIRLEVTDTGIGIPAEALPRIFDEFYRAKNAKALGVEGTGLGLVIAQDIVEEHGGQISVQSQVGEGSTFHVTLPARTMPTGKPIDN